MLESWIYLCYSNCKNFIIILILALFDVFDYFGLIAVYIYCFQGYLYLVKMIKEEIITNLIIFYINAKKIVEFYCLIIIHFSVYDLLKTFSFYNCLFTTFLANFMCNLSAKNFTGQIFYILFKEYTIKNDYYLIFYSLILKRFLLRILKFKGFFIFIYSNLRPM